MTTTRVGVYSKADFCMLYKVKMRTFEKLIADIQPQIGWRVGERQKFPPRIVRIVLEYLGEPS